jgi:hypothetical protein
LEAWKNIAGEKLDQKLDPWIKYVNLLRQKYGINLLTNKQAQKQYLNGKTLMEYLYEVNKFHPSDNFEMYGNEPVKMFGFKLFRYTFQHMIEDKAMPDFIYVRPKWYLTYVQNLAHLLSVKFGLSISRLDLKKFEQMVGYITPKNITMKGIIDYEIAKAIRQTYVDVPVFYASQTHLIATADAMIWTNYSNIAKQVVVNTKAYMSEVDNRSIKRVEEKRKTVSIVNPQTGGVSKVSYIITYRIHF